jgi:bacterioferritin
VTDAAPFDHSSALAALQEALRWEHAAIVQFLLHAYRIGDLRTLHELEGMARQEMRHFKWLSERIVALGGNPTLERAELFLEAASPSIWLARDVALVEGAIARYSLGRETAPTPELARLYARLLDDEEDHRRKLIDLVEYWQEKPEPVPPLELEHEGVHATDADTRGFLDFAIQHEYAVILQYLHHAFLLPDQKASRELEEIAIEEMRHLGWLSERLIDRGGCPFWTPDRLELSEDPIEMLELDQAREIEVEADYQQMTAAMADPEIKRLFDRIGAHEAYHAGVIGELITRLKAEQAKQAPPPTRPHGPTIGSLLGEAQP